MTWAVTLLLCGTEVDAQDIHTKAGPRKQTTAWLAVVFFPLIGVAFVLCLFPSVPKLKTLEIAMLKSGQVSFVALTPVFQVCH